MTNVRPFDAYEIAPVVESPDGNCEQYDTLLAAQEAMGTDDKLIWSVYGHLPEGGVDCIYDCGCEDDAITFVYRITGKIEPVTGTSHLVRIGALESDVQTALRTLGAIDDSKLDVLVHDVASSIASDTNNSGVEQQVRFLMNHGVSVRDMLKAA